MTPRHATTTRLLQARIGQQAKAAGNWSYRAALVAAALVTGLWTVYATLSGGPS